MITLTDFLLARIAEDKEWARWAGAAQDAERSRGLAFVSSIASSSVTSAGRVLAECEAKRRVVERCAGTLAVDGWEYDDAPRLAEAVLYDLALTYADHPDYRDATMRADQ